MRRSDSLVRILCGVLVLVFALVFRAVFLTESLLDEILCSCNSLFRDSYRVGSDIGYESRLACARDLNTFIKLLGDGHRLLG